MEFGLVLGGGGMIGVGWETGVAEGCAEGGVDLTRARTMIGTSAGAILGSRLRVYGLGKPPADDDVDKTLPGDIFARLAPEAAREAFTTWIGMTGPDPETARRIGELALQTDNDGEAMVARMSSGQHPWPEGDLRICAVSTQTGQRHVFDRDSGVELGRCIAASSAVPAMFAPVSIDGVRYMDGQVHSSTSADLLADEELPLVVVLAPTCAVTADKMGALAERCLQAEVAALEAAGKRVIQVLPRAEDKESFGTSLMDATHVESAHAAGLAQGRALAAGELADLK